MKAPRIALFAIVLFGLQVTAAMLVTLLIGVADLDVLAASQIIVGFIVSICVFAYMSWTSPAKPYLMAFLVGILATLLGVVSSVILVGNLSLVNPTLLAFDFFLMLVAILIGVSLSVTVRRRRSAD
jgi:hypothetical protein